MTRILSSTALTVAALLSLGGAASGTEVNIQITTAQRGLVQVGYYDRDRHQGDIQCIRAPCSPARQRPRWDRGHGWGRPVIVRRGGWDRPDDCRTITKRRVNHWGKVITERTRVSY